MKRPSEVPSDEERRQVGRGRNSAGCLAHLEAWQIEFVAMTQGPNSSPWSSRGLAEAQAQTVRPPSSEGQGLAGSVERSKVGGGVSSRPAGSGFRCP